jgi:hypothetical protein
VIDDLGRSCFQLSLEIMFFLVVEGGLRFVDYGASNRV